MPLNERTNTWGDVQPSEYIGPAEPQGGHLIGALASLLGLGEWQRGERAGVPESAPGPGQNAIPDILSWLDAPAKAAAPLAAGMVKFAKKEYPNALLHRTFKKPEEIDYIMSILEGKLPKTQVPSSLVSPGYTSVFGSDTPGHAGLLFNVNDPKNIVHLGSEDLFSKSETAWTDNAKRALDNAWRKGNELEFGSQKADKYRNAVMKLDLMPKGKKWTPRRPTIDPNTDDPLETLIGEQIRKARASDRDPLRLHHNEVIYNIEDPNELAGVRLPYGDATSNPELIGALQRLVDKYHLPIYELPQTRDRGEQIKRLGSFFEGQWDTFNAPGETWIRPGR